MFLQLHNVVLFLVSSISGRLWRSNVPHVFNGLPGDHINGRWLKLAAGEKAQARVGTCWDYETLSCRFHCSNCFAMEMKCNGYKWI